MRLLLFNLATDADDPILGFTTGWIRALATRVDFIHVITMRAGRLDVPANVRVHSVGKENGYSEPRRAIEFYRLLFRVLRQDRIDVCFSHMIPIFTVLAAPVLKPSGTPIVTWYTHGGVTRTLKLAHHFSDRMVSASPGSYRYIHDKLVSFGHGIDTNLFSPGPMSIDDSPLLLSVARLSPIKDMFTLITAVSLLRQRGYDVRCALVGDAPERDRAYAISIRRKVKELCLEDAVEFVGSVSQTEVVQWYRRCFAHINCSGPYSLDKAVLEAMACAKPSLSSVLDFQETMGSWADILLFREKDPEDLAGKIAQLLKQQDSEREKLGMQLRRRIVSKHSLEQLSKRLVDLFAGLREDRRVNFFPKLSL